MTHTVAQLAAIRRAARDVCVVAGPGSGKTTVLIERFAWLVEDRKLDPSRILAITFTEKAAGEIRQRLARRFDAASAANPDFRDSIERAWVSTIDGFCARLLRENAIAAGVAPDFEVLDPARAHRMARAAAEQALDEMFEAHPAEMRRLFEALDLSTSDTGSKPDLARGLLDVYESMRIAGFVELPPARPAEDVWPRAHELAAVMRDDRAPMGAHVPAMRDFAARFLNLPSNLTSDHFKTISGIKDINLGRIGKSSRAKSAADEFKNEIAGRLKQQWIAEYYSGVNHLLHRALKCLDEIYRDAKRRQAALDFAGLEEETIRLLETDPAIRERTASRFDQILMDELQDTNPLQWKLVNLIRRGFFGVGDINQSIYGFRHADPGVFARYRDEVVAAGVPVDDLRENHRSAGDILSAVERLLDHQPGIEDRPLIASRPDPGFVELLVGQGDQAREVEASLIADRIRQLCESGIKLNDIAILVRALTSIEPIEQALDAFGIPFVVSGGRTFLEAREIRDLMLLLAALVNPLDEIATVGVLRGPFVGMSDTEIFRIGRLGWQTDFEKLFGHLRKQSAFAPPDLLLARALDESGYLHRQSERARANIEKFLAHVRREHRRQPRPLAELLDDLEALRLTQSEAEAPPPDAHNAVRLMTIHAAKGLEFKIVFVSALQRTTDPSQSPIAFSAAFGFGAKWRNPATGEGQPDAAHQAIREELKKKETEEENRLLYVAMTRAADGLILSYAESKRASRWQKLVAESIAPTNASACPVAPQPQSLQLAPRPPLDLLLDPPQTSLREASASVTAIATFHACPRKYSLSLSALDPQTILSDDGGEPGGRQFGSSVHRILAGETLDDPDALEMAARFQLSELAARASRASRIEREFDFLFYFEEVVLRGQIDLWFQEAGELIVVDYKTDRDLENLDARAQPPGAYEMQVQIYALALELYFGRRADRALLYYLRQDKIVDVPIDENAVRAAIQKFLAAQDSFEYKMAPGAHCRRCVFFRNGCEGIDAAGNLAAFG